MRRLAWHLLSLSLAVAAVGCGARRQPADRAAAADVTRCPAYHRFYAPGDVYEVVRPVQVAREAIGAHFHRELASRFA